MSGSISFTVTKDAGGGITLHTVGEPSPFDVLALAEFAVMRAKFRIIDGFRAADKAENESRPEATK